MKITKDAANQKETFLKTLFKDNQKISSFDANQLIFQQFGHRMSINRLYKIRQQVLGKVDRRKVSNNTDVDNIKTYSSI